MRPADVATIMQTRADLASGDARRARATARITQGEMASALSVSRSALGHWETGRSVPSAEHALAYGRLLRQLAKRAA